MPRPARNPAERVIGRFGGQSALAELLGRRQSTIEHWAATGRIPAQWHQPLMSLARQRGITLEARDFVEAQAHVIRPAGGRLGVLIVGLGAVASTFVAGVELIRRGHARPFGSLTQMGTIRLGKRTEDRMPLIRDLVPLADLDQLVFGAWDPFPDNAYQAALKAGVLDRHSHLEPVAGELSELEPMPAVFDQAYVKRLNGPNVKRLAGKRQLAETIRQDIRDFKDARACDRLVMIWCGSTEVYLEEGPAHRDPGSFERGLELDDDSIAPSMLYAYAALMEGVPFINGAPNLTVDIPAMVALANERVVPICGKDFKTGQTLIKTVISPMLKARMLGLRGWYSTNILGNRDGEVLDDPDSFRTKEETKRGVLEHILQPAVYPELYGDVYHKVRINYYPPRGDSKEGWDNVDIFGWLGYPMQIKIDFLCRDSILAAPLVLDLVLFTDLAQRAGMRGIQEWLSFYFKSPQHAPSIYPEHDLFIQQTKLKNTLRWLMGEEPITHLGMEYYQQD
ncbi:MAG TPA: inositol-3-phosphate synthase [Candidatus Dormibacteraeota bacterium]|nr:inositol-3-phosphate synthase [Candidatus Dormibacteraeota bacterium]